MNGNTFCGGAFPENRSFGRYQLRAMAFRLESVEHQQRLILSTPPFRFEIDQQNPHESALRPARFAATSVPSLVYFKRTVRAAICAISAPR